MCRHTRKGFTLIELLVVISIIALLISILLPALRMARETARGIQCLSGQRQVALAMTSYQADNNEYFTPYYYNGTAAGSPFAGTTLHTTNWANALYRFQYLPGAAQVLICPSFTEGNTLPIPTLPEKQNLVQTHFGYNFRHIGSSLYALGTANPAWQWTPARANDITKPSQTYLVMDAVRNYTSEVLMSQGTYVVVDVFSTGGFNPMAHHGADRKTLNLTWADGHGSSIMLANRLLPYEELGSYIAGTENFWDRD